MSFELRRIEADAYASQVLPRTATLWSHGRSEETYISQVNGVANSPYGRKYYRTYALTQGSGSILASFKRYERSARSGNELLRCAGIGAVFTPEEFRGRGYASAMLGMALDEAKRAGFDFAFLFSDIHPQFYKELGFGEFPSRSISMRADALDGARISAEPLAERDWSAVRKCFDAVQERAQFGLTRSPLVWDWIRLRLQQNAERRRGGQAVDLVVRSGRSILAYAIGQREPKHDAYIVDEFGYADDRGAALIPALLRAAAGDLRRVAGWLPPAGARDLLPRGSVRRRSDAVWMIAPLSAAGTRFAQRAKTSGSADGIWSLDHI